MPTRSFAILLLSTAFAAAQPTVAPAPETVGSTRGENWNGYNILNSFETGYRFHTVDGNAGKYRSDVNFGNGISLLSSSLTVNSREGRGGLFDELVLNTQGLGNDPYQFSNLRFQKNKLYRYDFLWRMNQYYNPALTISGGQHLLDTTRTLQDHDLVLLPQSRLRLLVGYSRNRLTGPGLSTAQLFDARGDEFPVFSNVNRLNNEFRLGGEAEIGGLKLHVLHAWDSYREDDPRSLGSGSAGNNPDDRTTLTSLGRRQPYEGNTPWWRGNLLYDRKKWFSASARMTYAGGARHFALDETAVGTDRFGANRNRQVLISGNGARPVAAGSATLSLFPTDRLIIANQTAVHNTRMVGNSQYQEINNGSTFGRIINYQYLGIRLVGNLTDLNYKLARWASLYGGFHYASRRIQSTEYSDVEPPGPRTPFAQSNQLRAGLVGLRLQPLKPLRVSLDGELGRTDRPFYPVSEKNYHALGARVQWKARTLALSAAARSNYNFNSVSLTAHSSQSRNYSFDAGWTPRRGFSIDAGYSKMHLDTLSGIAYFASFRLVEGERSLYVSNLHTGYLGARASIGSRVDLFVGFHRVQDAGDGRPGLESGPAAASLPAFIAAQTFPIRFQSPLARVSVRLHNKLRWNAGYQYYDYGEQFGLRQDYRANTGYTSVTWSF